MGLLSKRDTGFPKAGVTGRRVFASHFPSDEVQDETFSEDPRRGTGFGN